MNSQIMNIYNLRLNLLLNMNMFDDSIEYWISYNIPPLLQKRVIEVNMDNPNHQKDPLVILLSQHRVLKDYKLVSLQLREDVNF